MNRDDALVIDNLGEVNMSQLTKSILHRKMPKTGDDLSILGFGCMRLPTLDGKIDEARAISQIRNAIDCGVNYVDTAWPYHAGESETVLGKALRDGYRERVKLATKLPSWLITSREDMDRYLDAQLGKLQTDRIDYYLLHNIDGKSWEKLNRLGVDEFLRQARNDGRIVNAGFSFHGAGGDFSGIVDAYPWEFCQIQFNYLDEYTQAGVAGLEYAASKGLGVIVMEPLRGGDLGRPTAPLPVAEIWDKAPTRRTPAEWGLRWVWNRPEVTVVLSGMNDEAHIAENVAIASDAYPNSLTGEELALVNRAGETYQSLLKVGCTGCGYCMPCPSNVMIPTCFAEYNKMHLFGPVNEVKFTYALRMSGLVMHGQPGYASQCVRCGACLEHCPQHILIPDMLARVVDEFEGPELKENLEIAKKIFQIKA
jgi:predicted aldo/keto reductase-like oxidoreductase